MLKPELARAQLEAARNDKNRLERVARLKSLPADLAAAGYGLFNLGPSGKPFRDWSKRNKAERDALELLVTQPKARARVLSLLYPTLSGAIEAGLGVFDDIPYTEGSNRRGFRCPGRPSLYKGQRREYLEHVIDCTASVADETLSPAWLAGFANHLGYHSGDLGYLFAGVVNRGGPAGEEMLETLKDCAAGRHDIGGPGRFAFRGLLACRNPDAWDFTEKLLLAAQRQEGLRQSILEMVDESHPDAFPRMVKLCLDHNLIRFGSVARAVAVWLGEEQSAEKPKELKAAMETIHALLADPAAREQAISKGKGAECYRGLWAVAFRDTEDALRQALPLLADANVGRRMAAMKLAEESGLPEVADAMIGRIDDGDPRIVSLAVSYISSEVQALPETGKPDPDKPAAPKDLFERVEKLLPTLPEKPKEFKSPVEGWHVPTLDQGDAAGILNRHLGKRPVERMLPYLELLGGYEQRQLILKLAKPRTLTTKVRQVLVSIAGHRDSYVREAALEALKKCKLAEDEVQTLEGYLTRKTADFRRGVLTLLANRPDKLALGTAERLLNAKDGNQRGAGIELARMLAESKRQPDAIRAALQGHLDTRGKRVSKGEEAAIELILNPPAPPATLDDCLGLVQPGEIGLGVPPTPREVPFATAAAQAFLKSLDDLVHANRTRTFEVQRGSGAADTRVIGSIEYAWYIPAPDAAKSAEENRAAFPLGDLFEGWYESRPEETRDDDGLELLRAQQLSTFRIREGEKDTAEAGGVAKVEYEDGEEPEDEDEDDLDDDEEDEPVKKGKKAKPLPENQRPLAEFPEYQAALLKLSPLPAQGLRYEAVVERVLQWLAFLHPLPGATAFALDAAEAALALVPQFALDRRPLPADKKGNVPTFYDWRDGDFTDWLKVAQALRTNPRAAWTPDDTRRLYELSKWVDRPGDGVPRKRCDIDELIAAHEAGAATAAEFIDHLVGPRDKPRYSWYGSSFDSLRDLTRPGVADEKLGELAVSPLRQALEQVRDTILEIELARGEAPTGASHPAGVIQSVYGADLLFRLVAALPKNGFAKSSSGQSKPAVLTHLIKVCHPLPGDAPEAFAARAKALIKAGDVPPERFLELGLLNLRWLDHAEATINWPGLREAAYWFLAHIEGVSTAALEDAAHEDEGDFDDDDLDDDDDFEDDGAAAAKKPESAWSKLVKARTTLTPEQRQDGLIDVAWFHQAYGALGKRARWQAVELATRFVGYGQGYKKAARLADVLLGRMKKRELVAAIRKKFLKEHVKLLGLLPLPADQAKWDAELRDRYKVLKEYERYARQLSALSKEPAMQAARLALQNLALTAGLAEPMRLEWAVTAREVADLLEGPVVASVKNVSVTLSLTDQAEPVVTQARDGKPLKQIPPDVRKAPKVAELVERKANLKRMASNTKRSLEQAMCAGDKFHAPELAALMGHALVRPLLERLVVKTPSGMGYPVRGGQALRGADGALISVNADDAWTVAHPLDLLAAGGWPAWQSECFRTERLQPFKQVFREVYVPTGPEKQDGDHSQRYSGQQVNEQQANALFGSRGWSVREGISKLFREQGIQVDVGLGRGYFTPAEAEAPTVSRVVFTRRGEWKPMLLVDVPATIFSEVMRDCDLVVSVAHVGGVDPEATQSTVEMRASLLRETCSLLKVDNVSCDDRHALIKGEYGQYSVHLGSGTVHKQPGGSLCVVPVHAQHRGRLFLPFADDDPRTAEVVSKVLLLARDKEIQDPTILEQLMNR